MADAGCTAYKSFVFLGTQSRDPVYSAEVPVYVCVCGVGMKTLRGGRRAEEMGDVEGAYSGYRLLGILPINRDNPDQLDVIAPYVVN